MALRRKLDAHPRFVKRVYWTPILVYKQRSLRYTSLDKKTSIGHCLHVGVHKYSKWATPAFPIHTGPDSVVMR